MEAGAGLYSFLSKGLTYLIAADSEGLKRFADLEGTSLVLVSTDLAWHVRLCMQAGQCSLLPYEPAAADTKVIGGVSVLLDFLKTGARQGYSAPALLECLSVEGDVDLAGQWLTTITSLRPSLTSVLQQLTGAGKANTDG